MQWFTSEHEVEQTCEEEAMRFKISLKPASVGRGEDSIKNVNKYMLGFPVRFEFFCQIIQSQLISR